MISASVVKELREMTGAGMMDCKRALTETDGAIDKAVELLREKGLAAAAKKAGRIASEGIVCTHISEDMKLGSVVEVNCETDFVSANEDFVNLAKNVALQAAQTTSTTIEEFVSEKYIANKEITVTDAVTELISKLG
ncbi:MAG: translation elongation factor Ts, partial [Clostridiaceae bacterium]|nr:translation elongation factor Ts [Clostridiaceae bacterium]